MTREHINLLPPDRNRAFLRGYMMRVLTTGLILLALLVVAHGILLAPSYLYLVEQANAREQELTELTERLNANGGDTSNAELGVLERDAAQLARLDGLPRTSAVVSALLQVGHQGVALSSFAFTLPTEQGGEGQLVLVGIAENREVLQGYVETLAALPFISRVDLPISAYAKETDISFSMNLAGSFLP